MILLVNLSTCSNAISINAEEEIVSNEVNCFGMINDGLQKIDSGTILLTNIFKYL